MVNLALALLLSVKPVAAPPPPVEMAAPEEDVAPNTDPDGPPSGDDIIPAVSDVTAVRWSITSTNRAVVATGRTNVSATVATPTPKSGYAVLQVEIDNALGPNGEVRLTFTSNSMGGRPVTRVVGVKAGERRTVVLPVPFHWRYGTMRASGAGIESSNQTSVYFNNVYPVQPVVLALGSAAEMERFMKSRPLTDSSKSNVTVVTLAASNAPVELAAYVGYDAVVLPRAGFDSLAEGQRAALEAYAATGGNLVLGGSSRGAVSALPLWKDEPQGRYGFGRVLLCGECTPKLGFFAHQVPVTPSNSNVINSRYPSGDSSTALLPQAHVPVGRFLVIILLFTLAIGPGSVLVARRRGPSALLVTVPGTAFATCMLIIGMAAFQDGFTVHGQSNGITLLDTQRHRAITLAVTAYYANLGPSGAHLPVTTALVGPVNESGEAFNTSLDWTQGLSLGSDFVPSRTYREWGFIGVEPTRARLVVKDGGGVPVVQNALGASVTELFLRWHGELFSVTALRDGQESSAHRVAEVKSLLPVPAVKARFGSAVWDQEARPLKDGEFLAWLEGQAFTPTAGLSLAHSDSGHLVLGEVER